MEMDKGRMQLVGGKRISILSERSVVHACTTALTGLSFLTRGERQTLSPIQFTLEHACTHFFPLSSLKF
jgi:hypothetical protein